eukprot:TRINITY_DN3288_c0_g1_i2.p1 TRINITY_DN3288_c0_g1~~TRINITY_DN3288_c0_g1_i2.p1  ORF type:complete len:2739 (-),score=349.05 TRINITY_DN3288_c0_g1_i2:856-9072(-)
MTDMADAQDKRSDSRNRGREGPNSQRNETAGEAERTGHMSILKHIRQSGDYRAQHGTAGNWAGSRQKTPRTGTTRLGDKKVQEEREIRKDMQRTESKRSFAVKSIKASKPPSQPDTFFTGSWKLAQLDAFVRQFMHSKMDEYKGVAVKEQKTALVDKYIREHFDKFKRIGTQRQFNAFGVTLVESQEKLFAEFIAERSTGKHDEEFSQDEDVETLLNEALGMHSSHRDKEEEAMGYSSGPEMISPSNKESSGSRLARRPRVSPLIHQEALDSKNQIKRGQERDLPASQIKEAQREIWDVDEDEDPTLMDSIEDMCRSSSVHEPPSSSAAAMGAALNPEMYDCRIEASELALVIPEDTLRQAAVLINQMHAFDFKAPMAKVEMFWHHVYVPMVQTQGAVYEYMDQSRDIQKHRASDEKKTGDVLVAVSLESRKGKVSRRRQATDVLIYKNMVRQYNQIRKGQFVFMVNALVLHPELRVEDRKAMRLSVWNTDNLADVASLRASLMNDPRKALLVQPVWPSVQKWKIDLEFEGVTPRLNKDRIKATGTAWYTNNFRPRKSEDGRPPKPDEREMHRQLRAVAKLDFHATSVKVELNLRIPLITFMSLIVCRTVKSHTSGRTPIQGIPEKLASAFARTPKVTLADLQAGVPRYRLRAAAQITAAVTGTKVLVANTDVFPVLYSLDPNLTIPFNFNRLDQDLDNDEACVRFLDSLRYTAEGVADGVDNIQLLDVPTMLSMSMARGQIAQWISAIDDSPMIMAVELVTPVHDPPIFKHLARVGPAVRLPQQSGITVGVEEFAACDREAAIFIRKDIWRAAQKEGMLQELRGLHLLDGMYDSVHPILSGGLLYRSIILGDSGDRVKQGLPDRVDLLTEPSAGVERRSSSIAPGSALQPDTLVEDLAMHAPSPPANDRSLSTVIRDVTFGRVKVANMDLDLLTLIWKATNYGAALPCEIAGDIAQAMKAFETRKKDEESAEDLMMQFKRRIEKITLSDELDAVWQEVDGIKDDKVSIALLNALMERAKIIMTSTQSNRQVSTPSMMPAAATVSALDEQPTIASREGEDCDEEEDWDDIPIESLDAFRLAELWTQSSSGAKLPDGVKVRCAERAEVLVQASKSSPGVGAVQEEAGTAAEQDPPKELKPSASKSSPIPIPSPNPSLDPSSETSLEPKPLGSTPREADLKDMDTEEGGAEVHREEAGKGDSPLIPARLELVLDEQAKVSKDNQKVRASKRSRTPSVKAVEACELSNRDRGTRRRRMNDEQPIVRNHRYDEQGKDRRKRRNWSQGEEPRRSNKNDSGLLNCCPYPCSLEQQIRHSVGTHISRDVGVSEDQRHAELEHRLMTVWSDAVNEYVSAEARRHAESESGNFTMFQISLDIFRPILEVFGCYRGGKMQPWIAELGVLRSARSLQEQKMLSFPSLDFELVCQTAKAFGWSVWESDGSRRRVRGAFSAAGAAMDTQNLSKAFVIKARGPVQSNTRGEYEGGLLAALAAGPVNTLIVSDSTDFGNVMDQPLEEFVELVRRGAHKNALPAVLVKLLQHVGRGFCRKQVVHIYAHCGCVQQDAVDKAAGAACHLQQMQDSRDCIDLMSCIEVIDSWSIPSTERKGSKGVGFPKAGSREALKSRLNVAQLWKGSNSIRLAERMKEETHRSAVDLSRAIDNHGEMSKRENGGDADEWLADRVGVIEERWRKRAIEETNKITGTIPVGGSSNRQKKHTDHFIKAREELRILEARLEIAESWFESIRPSEEQLKNPALAFWDVLTVLDRRGHGADPFESSWSIADIIQEVARLTQEHEICPRQRSFSGIREMLVGAREAVVANQEELENECQDDFKQEDVSRVFRIWRAKGPSKTLSRAMSACTRANEFQFKIPAQSFVDLVAGKSKAPASAWMSEEDCSWESPVCAVSTDSLAGFARPWSAGEVDRVLRAAKKGKAFSVLSQMSKDMLKAIAHPGVHQERVRAKLDLGVLRDDEGDAVAADAQHLVEAADAMGLEEGDDRELGMSHMIANLFNAMELAGKTSDMWQEIMLCTIFKEKVDPMKALSESQVDDICKDPEHWREISLADAFRTLYGSCVHRRWDVFSMENDLHKHVQLAYVGGLDPILIHHTRFDLVHLLASTNGMPWSNVPLNVAVLNADFKYFFSTFTSETREVIMQDNQFPEIRRRGLRAIHANMTMTMLEDGKSTRPARVDCELQGSAEACTFATAAYTSLLEMLDRSGKGFLLPSSEQHGLPAPPTRCFFGGAQCDDIILLAGGVGKTAEQTVEDIKCLAGILRAWATHHKFIFSVDPSRPEKSKTALAIWTVDELGLHTSMDVSITLPTREGPCKIPILHDNAAFKSLGVMRMRDRAQQKEANASQCVEKTISKADRLLLKSFPAMSMQAALQSSIIGSTEWMLTKTEVPWSLVTSSHDFKLRETKAALGLAKSTLSAYLLADTKHGGCGMSSPKHTALVSSVNALISSANSKNLFVRRLFRYAVAISCVINRIDTLDIDTRRPEERIFLDWDCRKLSFAEIDKLQATPLIALSIRFCMTYGATLLCCRKSDEFMLRYNLGGEDVYSADGEKIKKDFDWIHSGRMRVELMESNLDCAAKDATTVAQLAQGNLWRSDRSIQEGVRRTAIKMAVDALPTGRNLFLWNTVVTPACGCGAPWASAAHIFQSCALVHNLITERSQMLVQHCLDAISVSGSSFWSFVGRPGCHPPDFLLPEDWRSSLQPVAEIKEGVEVMVQHRLPDIILANAIADG